MQQIGTVIEIFSQSKTSTAKKRPIVKELNLIKEHGIENDKFAGKNLDRAVMMVGTIAYDIANNNNIDTDKGDYKENILLDFDPHEYKQGTVFVIGEAEIEITMDCDVCASLANFNKKLPKLITGHRGLYCKINKNGKITKNMPVYTK
jgi:MOSC domain-containing protein YiiM